MSGDWGIKLKDSRNELSLRTIFVMNDIDESSGKGGLTLMFSGSPFSSQSCSSDFLYVFMGQVFSKNSKIVWDELKETYSKQDASVIFNMHFKIHSLSQYGSHLSEYYHKFNALWRQYDSLVNFPDCICKNSEKLKKHNQLLKLMQFLMGIDEVYAPIKSIILTADLIPNVKGDFTTLSRDESIKHIDLD
ncbi:ribonuclease H-like domain-containing protein [Tanacetum coccineum]